MTEITGSTQNKTDPIEDSSPLQGLMRRVLSATIGESWKTFTAQSREEMSEHATTTLEEFGWDYDRRTIEPSVGERTLYGSNGTTYFELPDKGLEIWCTSVTFDPIQRVVFGLGVSQSTRERYKESVSLIRIEPITEATETQVRAFVREIATEFDSNPWDIVHPRFNHSPLLKYKVKLLWRYWLADTESECS